MEPELASLVDQSERISADAESLTKGLDDSQLLWQPSANTWSISECIAHLVVVDGLDLPHLRAAIADAREKGITGQGPFRYGLLSGWFVNSMEPPVKRMRSRAPARYVPPQVTDPRMTIVEFLTIQTELRAIIRSADGLDLARVKTPLPTLPRIKMSIGRRFQLMAAHDRRHLWQARQVLNAMPAERRAASGTIG